MSSSTVETNIQTTEITATGKDAHLALLGHQLALAQAVIQARAEAEGRAQK